MTKKIRNTDTPNHSAPSRFGLIAVLALAFSGISCSNLENAATKKTAPPANLAGTWSGKSKDGHRLTINVAQSGTGYKLAAPPQWTIREPLGERMFRSRVAGPVAGSVGDLLSAFRRPSEPGTSPPALPPAPEQAWNPNGRTLSYKTGGWGPHEERDFTFAKDRLETRYYSFKFRTDGTATAVLNRDIESLEMKRR